VKRTFDVVFAGIGLLVLSPLLVVIAAAIKLDSAGPVLYRQTRTAAFGDTFTVAKFRTMRPKSEDAVPVDDVENDRITRVGRVLRRTHLDEIPQLLVIFRGRMSVVGPRAAWVDEETLLEDQTNAWRRRWFVKPGLTGLAQINEVSSTDPEAKLRYDIEYIRNQSFWFDLKIVIRQLWLVGEDLLNR
jgi:lipopolysaccharide/colanic/teichoic acid biosynthesis glycosyltransferase